MSGEAPSFTGLPTTMPSNITVRGSSSSSPYTPWADDRLPTHHHRHESRSSTHSQSNMREGLTPASSPSSFHFSPNPNDNPHAISSSVPSVHQFSDDLQEKFIVQELIHVLGGLESNLITCHNVTPSKLGYIVDRRILPSISTFATEVTELAGHYYTVTRFVEKIHKFEHGRVNHALVSTIEEILKEYYILLSQLNVECRKGELNLRNLWFFISPSLARMAVVSSVVAEIEEKQLTGGAVLTLLHEKAVNMNNSSDQNLCYALAEKVSIPYFETLEQWIYTGVIKDKFQEFFVIDSDKSGEEAELTDNYWEKRYTTLPDKCPSFLLKNITQVQKAGKYLNVIRHCGKDIKTFRGEKIVYSIHERDYVDKIEKAYSYASKKLLTLLLDEYDLMKRLQSVKHYLLMDKGDFIVQFMDLTDAELNKPIDDLNPSRLESLMGLALRTSSASTDPYKDCLKVQLFPYGIGEQLMTIIAIETPLERSDFHQACNYKIPGIEGFSFSYEVKWPISLVLTARLIVCYQLVFRHLFFCKHVERQLCNIWIHGKGSTGKALSTRREQAAVFALRQKMLNFVQNFQYYMAFEVIEPAWNAFLNTMQKVTNVDSVLKCHLEMVTSILDDSMLTSQILLEKINKILALCLRFCKKIALMFEQSTAEPNIYEKVITADVKFCKLLVNFLQEVSSISQNSNKSNKVGNIIHRMNFNGFYTNSLENNDSLHRNSLVTPTISSGLKIFGKAS